MDFSRDLLYILIMKNEGKVHAATIYFNNKEMKQWWREEARKMGRCLGPHITHLLTNIYEEKVAATLKEGCSGK